MLFSPMYPRAQPSPPDRINPIPHLSFLTRITLQPRCISLSETTADIVLIIMKQKIGIVEYQPFFTMFTCRTSWMYVGNMTYFITDV